VLQDGSVSSEALGGEWRGSQTVCVRDGEQKGKVLKTWYSVRSDADHGLAVACPLLHGFCALGELGKVSPTLNPASQKLMQCVCVCQTVDLSTTVIWHDTYMNRKGLSQQG